MGVEYAIACAECRQFIDLHKWPVIDGAARSLHASFGLAGSEYSPGFPTVRRPAISRNPIIIVTPNQISAGIADHVPHPELAYIDELILGVRRFSDSHCSHTLFLSCDTGDQPWDYGEPCWDEWKEIRGAFFHSSKYLPRNLVDDYGVSSLEDAIAVMQDGHEWAIVQSDDEWERAFRASLADRLKHLTRRC